MSKRPGGILAVYQYLDNLVDAMKAVQARPDCAGHEVFSPTSYHEIEEALDAGPSPVRWFTLSGALTGTVTGFGLALWLDYDWPQVVGGKLAGLYSIPSYVVIGFELTILFGGLMTILGMLVMGRLPNPKQRILDPRFTDDRFGIFVPNASLDSEQARLLKSFGAEEIRIIESK
jgi:molybdopterin-containing oxidoreductase family membrane subunit